MNNNPEEIKEFAKKAMPILSQYGYLEGESKMERIIKYSAIFLCALIIGGVLMYGIASDKFKSEVNINQTLEPQIETNNQYDFKPSTLNEYEFRPNYTIVVENYIECPGVINES